MAEAIDLNPPTPVITLTLLERLCSREYDSFADKLLAAMRNECGGHSIESVWATPASDCTGVAAMSATAFRRG